MNNMDNKTKSKKYIPLISGIIFLFILIFYIFTELVYASQVLPNTKFADTDIGGMDIGLVESKVEKLINQVQDEKIIFINDKKSFSYSLEELGIDLNILDNQITVTKFAKEINPFTNLYFRVKVLFGGTQISIKYNLNDNFNQVLSKIESDINIDPLSANIIVNDKTAKVEPMVVGYKLDKDLLKKYIDSHLIKLDFKPIEIPITSYAPFVDTDVATVVSDKLNRQLANEYILKFDDEVFKLTSDDLWQWVNIDNNNDHFVISLDENKLEAYVKNLEGLIDRPMQNAKLKIKDNKVTQFASHQSGAVLRVKDTARLIQSNLLTAQREFDLPINYLKPKTTLVDLNKLGINELVAKGVSNFSGSPRNRRHNIATGASRFDLILIEAGETFSFNKILGEVDESTGYLPELVIKGDETIPEYGGGLCQVSTTAFRAILNGGYPVVARKNHSYRVSYYEPAGSDATIYPPYPDLKFTNDSKGSILIDTYIEGNNLYFDFYGTKPTYEVKIEGPNIYNITGYPDPVYIETSTIPEGEVKQIDTAHRGADAVLYRYIYDEAGIQIRKDVFESHYIPWPAKFLVGVIEAPELETNLDNILPESSASEEAAIELETE